MLSNRLQQLALFVRADLRSDTERGRLVRATAMAAGLHAAAAVLAFLASLFYARGLGPHGYGMYAYVLAWVAILAIPISLGIPPYLVREGTRSPQGVPSLRRWADIRILFTGTAAMILMAAVALVPYAAGARWLFVIAAPLPLLTAFASVRSALMQARGYVARSLWPRLLLAPGLTLIVFWCLWMWGGRTSAVDLMFATLAVAIVTLAINTTQLRRIAPDDAHNQAVTVSTRTALSFMWVAALFLLNSRADLIILGSLNGAHEAGVYAVASRAAELASFLMAAANMILGPKIAQLYQSGEWALLERMIQGATRRILIFSLPIALVLVVWARPVLSQLYGEQFAAGAVVLQVLVIAQILTVASGPLGNLLNMTGHEKLSVRSMLVSVLLNVALNFLLIPHYGATGAAAATAISLACSRLLLWYFVRREFAFRRA